MFARESADPQGQAQTGSWSPMQLGRPTDSTLVSGHLGFVLVIVQSALEPS